MAIQDGQLGLIAEISPRYVNGRLSSLVLMSLSTRLATPFTSVSISALRVACVYAPRHLHASPIGQNSAPRAGRVALPSSQGRINPTPDGPSTAKRPAAVPMGRRQHLTTCLASLQRRAQHIEASPLHIPNINDDTEAYR